MTIVASQNLSVLATDESTREYTVKYVLIGAVLQGVTQLGPFFAIFFSVTGRNDQWPLRLVGLLVDLSGCDPRLQPSQK